MGMQIKLTGQKEMVLRLITVSILAVLLYIASVLWMTHLREYATADIDYATYQCKEVMTNGLGPVYRQ